MYMYNGKCLSTTLSLQCIMVRGRHLTAFRVGYQQVKRAEDGLFKYEISYQNVFKPMETRTECGPKIVRVRVPGGCKWSAFVALPLLSLSGVS